MLINSLSNAGAVPRSSKTTSSGSDTTFNSFSSALDVAQMRLAQNADTPTRTLSTTSEATPPPERVYRSEAARELAEYAEKSVAERVRDAILKDMGLTEEELAAMDPEKRAAIEEEIARRVKAMLTGLQGSEQPQADRVSGLASGLELA